MDIIDLVAMGLLKETQDEMLAITKEETPELVGRVHIACWSGLTEETREFWRDQAGNFPVSEEKCLECNGSGCWPTAHKKCPDCNGTGKLSKTLKQLIGEA